eukprot:TRINITY_DN652_c0_g1_i1.p1 TRINITY_DN652_c0_g1~~TRINITY_DN652_c0_g1_i1.p1  ORF type:complete len:242 (-),score=56.23 TRINITY_DN652_c0_g1_i1:353-1078(-)
MSNLSLEAEIPLDAHTYWTLLQNKEFDNYQAELLGNLSKVEEIETATLQLADLFEDAQVSQSWSEWWYGAQPTVERRRLPNTEDVVNAIVPRRRVKLHLNIVLPATLVSLAGIETFWFEEVRTYFHHKRAADAAAQEPQTVEDPVLQEILQRVQKHAEYFEVRYTTLLPVPESFGKISGSLFVIPIDEHKCLQLTYVNCVLGVVGIGPLVTQLLTYELGRVYTDIPSVVEKWNSRGNEASS